MKKIWLIAAMAAALTLAACSSDNEAAESDAENETETTAKEETNETSSSLKLLEEEVSVDGAVITVTRSQVSEQLEEDNRVYEILLSVANDSEEELTLTQDQFTLMDLADEEKEVYGEELELTIPAGETAEGALHYTATSTTAFKLIGAFEENEVEWRLPGITSLD
ncbi:DUF4352 domain-containing protein [Jeotgalibacillus proteolyticus]|uniref:DUF4352 domain-containing protein n=1 Tax=Jeotgalibacillus proteolyticus TaxID=2082395 RepID=A0A2S5G7F4_9BACL|nr:DUF4352 domain-containing protein [Jeotgalibacillus proteolyticus]PPA68908.1 hypothetical protein C4B60_18500 [Jeotgalibacillus proteolyticus]